MPPKSASVTALNEEAASENWRAAVGDLLAEDGVRGVIVAVLYENRDYMVRQINVANSDLALIGAKLLRIATDDD